MSIFFGWVLPYIVIILFLIGIVVRVLNWVHIPVPFKLTVFPSPKTTSGAVADVAKETVGFRSLWRGKKGFWFMAWLFHISLAFLIVGHFFGIVFLGQQFTIFGVSGEKSMELSVFFGTYAGAALLLALVLLTIRRVISAKVRFVTSLSDYIVLVLLLGIALSGMYMRLFDEISYGVVKDYVVGLLTLHPIAPPDHLGFMTHFTLIQLLLLYFPYSKLMHTCGIFISRWLITRPHERQVIIK